MKRHAFVVQVNKNTVGPAIYPTLPIDVFFLGVIEVVQLGEGHVVQLEITAVTQQFSRDLTDPMPDSAARSESTRQDAQIARPPERRILGVEIEERKMAVFLWVQPGYDCRIAGGTVAEDRVEWLLVLKYIVQERLSAEYLPSKGVDKNKKRERTQVNPFLACSES